jgi:hypothetical protein
VPNILVVPNLVEELAEVVPITERGVIDPEDLIEPEEDLDEEDGALVNDEALLGDDPLVDDGLDDSLVNDDRLVDEDPPVDGPKVAEPIVAEVLEVFESPPSGLLPEGPSEPTISISSLDVILTCANCTYRRSKSNRT